MKTYDKEVGKKTDYKELYLRLMRASEKSIRVLIEAQQTCEEQLLRQGDDEDKAPQE